GPPPADGFLRPRICRSRILLGRYSQIPPQPVQLAALSTERATALPARLARISFVSGQSGNNAMRVAYVVPSFPAFFQTYILNEMIEVERAGHELIIVPLYSVNSPPQDERLRLLHGPAVLPASLFDRAVVQRALTAVCRRPRRVLKTIWSTEPQVVIYMR